MDVSYDKLQLNTQNIKTYIFLLCSILLEERYDCA